MRIIAGQLKGRKILKPSDSKTRPLKDLVKESIFNIIKHSKKLNINIENSSILDLFSGVGSFGLEALSRGANHVTFVENYPISLEILDKNITNLNLKDKCNIIEDDIFKNLNFVVLKKKFDLIFLDPPFIEKNILNLLLKIKQSNVLKNEGILILHRNSKDKNLLASKFKILEEKKYGISRIIFAKL